MHAKYQVSISQLQYQSFDQWQRDQLAKYDNPMRNERLFSELMGEWIGVRDNQIAWTALRFSDHLFVPSSDSFPINPETRGPKGHISCTWVQCATFLTDQPGWQFLFTRRPGKHKLVEDIEIFLPVKFHWIPFSGFREEVENVLANLRPGRPSCFFVRPEKQKLGRGCWYLASYQVLWNSVQRFQRRSWKCLSQSEAWEAIFFFPIGPKNTNLIKEVEILLPVKFHWIPFSGIREEVKNVSANQRPGRPSSFSNRPEKHKLRRGWDLASCQVSLNFVQRF